MKTNLCFNPLIQVYAFNKKKLMISTMKLYCFNPLIQVYAFNLKIIKKEFGGIENSFNPLIQVYAFNH